MALIGIRAIWASSVSGIPIIGSFSSSRCGSDPGGGLNPGGGGGCMHTFWGLLLSPPSQPHSQAQGPALHIWHVTVARTSWGSSRSMASFTGVGDSMGK